MSTICHELHQLFNGLKKYSHPFNFDDTPSNGIYIVFENGEFAHSVDRIVRVGSNRENRRLPTRLKQHFSRENRRGSIFRKNIGLTILSLDEDADGFQKKWNSKISNKNLSPEDLKKICETEEKVTECLDNFSFVVFEIKDKKEREELEKKIIATVAQCQECCPSKNWFGLHSPKEEIKKKGLWLSQHLNSTPLNDDDLKKLKQILGQ